MNGSSRGFIGTFELGAVFALALLAAQPSIAQVYMGRPAPVGNGFARVAVATNAAGAPTSVSVIIDARALDGLPAATTSRHEWEFLLAMPSRAPATGYDHVTLNWNPEGHPPQGVYTVPHFDVHFYLIDRPQQEAVTFQGPDRTAGLAAPTPALVPAGYAVIPDTAVEKMGVHAVNPASPEFHGHPFGHTFIYGYYRGRMVFLEPMVALSDLKSGGDVTVPVRTPSAYSLPGYYPTKYRVGPDRSRSHYTVSLLALKRYAPPAEAARR